MGGGGSSRFGGLEGRQDGGDERENKEMLRVDQFASKQKQGINYHKEIKDLKLICKGILDIMRSNIKENII